MFNKDTQPVSVEELNPILTFIQWSSGGHLYLERVRPQEAEIQQSYYAPNTNPRIVILTSAEASNLRCPFPACPQPQWE